MGELVIKKESGSDREMNEMQRQLTESIQSQTEMMRSLTEFNGKLTDRVCEVENNVSILFETIKKTMELDMQKMQAIRGQNEKITELENSYDELFKFAVLSNPTLAYFAFGTKISEILDIHQISKIYGKNTPFNLLNIVNSK
jgi:hypothetical protein